MKLKELGEFRFIDRITAGCLVRKEGVIKAIGDDCCVFRTPEGRVTLLTTDMLVEDIHFLVTAASCDQRRADGMGGGERGALPVRRKGG
jgi:thiamine-monophosphate kinase